MQGRSIDILSQILKYDSHSRVICLTVCCGKLLRTKLMDFLFKDLFSVPKSNANVLKTVYKTTKTMSIVNQIEHPLKKLVPRPLNKLILKSKLTLTTPIAEYLRPKHTMF